MVLCGVCCLIVVFGCACGINRGKGMRWLCTCVLGWCVCWLCVCLLCVAFVCVVVSLGAFVISLMLLFGGVSLCCVFVRHSWW